MAGGSTVASPASVIQSFETIDPGKLGIIDRKVLFALTRKLEPLFAPDELASLLDGSGALRDDSVDYVAFVNYVFASASARSTLANDAKERGRAAGMTLSNVSTAPTIVVDGEGCTGEVAQFIDGKRGRTLTDGSDCGSPVSSKFGGSPVSSKFTKTSRGSALTSQESDLELASNCGGEDSDEDASYPHVTPTSTLSSKELRGGLAHFYNTMFTEMTVVRFVDFALLPCIPRSDEVESLGENKAQDNTWALHRQNTMNRSRRHCVFVSHRWSSPLSEPPHPDDEDGTKHRLIVSGVEALADKRGWPLNSIDLWIDYACVDQLSSGPGSLKMLGVLSLLGYVSRADALLVPAMDGFNYPPRRDEDGNSYSYAHCVTTYGQRAWCRLEAFCMWTVGLLLGSRPPPLYAVALDNPGELVSLRVLLNADVRASAGDVHSEGDRMYIAAHEAAIERVYHRALIFTMCMAGTTDLNLGGQSLGAAHVRLLMFRLVVVCQGLRKLNLAGNQLGDDGAKEIAQNVLCLSELTHLHLAKNDIHDEGAEAIRGAIAQLPAFRGLDMKDNPCQQSLWIFGQGFEYA